MMYKEISIAAFLYLLISVSMLFAHTAGPHSNQICKVVFGFENSFELNNRVHTLPGGKKTIEANKLLGYVAAVSIDFNNNMNRDADIRTKDYKNLEKLKGKVKIPSPRELVIVTQIGKHRQVCHQGFDYDYINHEWQTRWQKGKQLLIDVVSYAFGKPRPVNPATAKFIAMIVYYSHIIGDLEEGETDSLGNIGNFYAMKNELANQIFLYGNQLPNPAHVSSLVAELRNLQFDSTKPELLQAKRFEYTTKLLDKLSEYVPQIISNNVDPSYVFNIDVDYQIAA